MNVADELKLFTLVAGYEGRIAQLEREVKRVATIEGGTTEAPKDAPKDVAPQKAMKTIRLRRAVRTADRCSHYVVSIDSEWAGQVWLAAIAAHNDAIEFAVRAAILHKCLVEDLSCAS
jgi:hypothetical protein